MNRLQSAQEIIGGGQSWKQTFTYDRYGNRRFDTNNTTTLPASCQTAACNPSIDPATNKLIGYVFDNAGNTTTDSQGRTFTYDAGNKQPKVVSGGQIVGEDSYDGDGKRVKKRNPGTGEQTVFVDDAMGKPVGEYSNVVEPAATAKVSYLTFDHLGSPRIMTDKNGNVIFQTRLYAVRRRNHGNADGAEKHQSQLRRRYGQTEIHRV